ncbi:MAG: hypothetical protein WKF28_11315, partial [Rubrobacteraceae bacterium]
ERSERFFVDLPETAPEVACHATWEPYDSIEEARDFLGSVIPNYERGEPANWGVTLRESGRLIGTCGFMAGSWEPEFARVELGPSPENIGAGA